MSTKLLRKLNKVTGEIKALSTAISRRCDWQALREARHRSATFLRETWCEKILAILIVMHYLFMRAKKAKKPQKGRKGRK